MSNKITFTTEDNQTKATFDYDNLQDVQVEAIKKVLGITPSGNQDITTLNEYDVTTKATARVSATERAKVVAGNIKKDVTILGVTGSYEGVDEQSIYSEINETAYGTPSGYSVAITMEEYSVSEKGGLSIYDGTSGSGTLLYSNTSGQAASSVINVTSTTGYLFILIGFQSGSIETNITNAVNATITSQGEISGAGLYTYNLTLSGNATMKLYVEYDY